MGLTVGSLFAGIGGMDLGLERAGMMVKWQVEIDDYATRVLAKHWPDVKRYRDVREVGRHNLEPVDLICGGFPCQDISNAGKRAGIDGERSGLWSEFARIIRELRPRYVLVENVAALLGRGIGRVLGDLAESGYDAEWDCIPAAAVGALHRRDRVWLVAYAAARGQSKCRSTSRSSRHADLGSQAVAHPEIQPMRNDSAHLRPTYREIDAPINTGLLSRKTALANPNNPRLEGRISGKLQECAGQRATRQGGSHSNSSYKAPMWRHRIFQSDSATQGNGTDQRGRTLGDGGWWTTEPDVGRVANGISARVDRLKGLGNAVVPQVAEWIGQRIMEAANDDHD